jgi:hypothetical protein
MITGYYCSYFRPPFRLFCIPRFFVIVIGNPSWNPCLARPMDESTKNVWRLFQICNASIYICTKIVSLRKREYEPVGIFYVHAYMSLWSLHGCFRIGFDTGMIFVSRLGLHSDEVQLLLNGDEFVPMRPKARGLSQHGGPPCWLDERDSAGCYFVRAGLSMPPALTDHTTCPGPVLIYCWMYTKHLHELRHGRKAWPCTLVDPWLLSW